MIVNVIQIFLVFGYYFKDLAEINPVKMACLIKALWITWQIQHHFRVATPVQLPKNGK